MIDKVETHDGGNVALISKWVSKEPITGRGIFLSLIGLVTTLIFGIHVGRLNHARYDKM